jgi:uroporphyrinogen decarboxylase
MNSQTCVMETLNRRPAPWVPVDFGGHRSRGISAIAYARLKEYLGIKPGGVYIYDVVQQLAIVEPEILDRYKIDTIELGRGYCLEPGDWKPWVLPDGTDCFVPKFVNLEQSGEEWYLVVNGRRAAVMRKGCVFFEQCYYPLADRDFANDPFDDLREMLPQTSWTGVAAPGWEYPLDADGLAKIRAAAERLRQSTDRAIIGLFGGNMYEIPCYLFGMDRYMTYMGLYPDACVRFSEKLYEIHLRNLETWLPVVGDCIDIIMFGDDLGSGKGPLMSPAMYRKYFGAYHKRLWQRAKELVPTIKTQLHCCGGIAPLLGDLIDQGLDSINPVQVGCTGMDPMDLKRKFGDRITFWGGGCDTRNVLPSGTPEEVRECVRGRFTAFSQGGGYVFQQIHNILSEVPPENIDAMFTEINRLRFAD